MKTAQRLCAVCCLLVLSASGCGLATYEQRLSEADEYFGYLNKLDAHLADSPWVADNGYGIEMRVPRGFALDTQQLPQPEGVEDAEPVIVPTPPTYLGVQDMEGLIAAWTASLPTAGGGAADAYLYVLGNHERFLIRAANDGEGADPAEFLNDLDFQLQELFQVTLPEGESDDAGADNVRYLESIPRVEKYAVPKEFRGVSFLPAPESSAGSLGMRAHLFTHESGPVQVAFLLIYPANVSTDPVESLTLALETLSVSDEPPQLQRPEDPETGPDLNF
ncbi:MAG: hypothetical protein DWQ34_20150 [Planctomycetota bacterium]|nr:MAG: hypothetical protein DWQ34_20150 [Planctomycetota bacterium]REJ93221.1 MAG: hypothetical protein DWQ29_04070 [Planctomycetota bacterium]REK29315.1 MAG: hypothetical protein DWQ41_04310 [Planctomycetota bacterium]REK35950.1 MAG: hypothetical protein DWQ45_10550 [Planctomycetota bacterium]